MGRGRANQSLISKWYPELNSEKENSYSSASIQFFISPQVVVVLTDGLTNDDDKETFNNATPALKAVAHVIAVGVAGKGYNAEKQRKQRAELLQIASSPDDVFYERSFEKLKERVDPIARRACPLYYKNPSV